MRLSQFIAFQEQMNQLYVISINRLLFEGGKGLQREGGADRHQHGIRWGR
jgi:hypothetical protein